MHLIKSTVYESPLFKGKGARAVQQFPPPPHQRTAHRHTLASALTRRPQTPISSRSC